MNFIQQQNNPGLLSQALQMYAAYSTGQSLMNGLNGAQKTPAAQSTPVAQPTSITPTAQQMQQINQKSGINANFAPQFSQPTQTFAQPNTFSGSLNGTQNINQWGNQNRNFNFGGGFGQ